MKIADKKIMPLLLICLIPVGRICNLVRSSLEVLQFSQPTRIPDYAHDCRPVKISYFRLCQYASGFKPSRQIHHHIMKCNLGPCSNRLNRCGYLLKMVWQVCLHWLHGSARHQRGTAFWGGGRDQSVEITVQQILGHEIHNIDLIIVHNFRAQNPFE